MFNRRTLASITAVAALAGGTAGGVTSSFTAPDGANAAVPPPTIGSVLSSKVVQVNSEVLREALRTDTDRIKAIERSVNALNAKVDGVNAKVDGVNARAAETKEMIDSLTGMTARSANGRSLVNIVEDIQHKARLICAETVPVEVLGISGRDPACD